MAEDRKRGAKKFLTLFGLFVLCVLGAYGYGRWQGAQVAQALQSQAAAERASAEANIAHSQSATADLGGRVEMLEARRRLHRALMALDERNFGTAGAELAAAGRHLAAVSPPPAGADGAVLTRMAGELQSAQIAVTEDLSQQRGRILQWVRELDAQFPDDAGTAAATAAPAGEAGSGGASPAAAGSMPVPSGTAPQSAPGGSNP